MYDCSQRSRGRTPAARQAERNRHVLAVAERLFLEQGYHRIGLALVASSAGVATRTIYACFGKKRALLEGILEYRRDASEQALAAWSCQRLSLGTALYLLAAHAFEHELSPCVQLLHADLLSERSALLPSGRRWALEGPWRALLERTLSPSCPKFADVFVASLMREHLSMPPTRVGDELSATAIDAMVRRCVAHFLALVPVMAHPGDSPDSAPRPMRPPFPAHTDQLSNVGHGGVLACCQRLSFSP